MLVSFIYYFFRVEGVFLFPVLAPSVGSNVRWSPKFGLT